MSKFRPHHQRVTYSHACVAALAALDGDEVVESASIESALQHTTDRLGIERGLLRKLTGIEQRRLFARDQQPSDVAAAAGKAALQQAGIDAADVDLLMSTSVSQDHVEPATAAAVHAKLGLPRSAINFDVKNACLGFVTAMDIAATMIDAGRIGVALVVAGEVSRAMTEATIARLQEPTATTQMYRDQFVALTFGSSATAAVLTHRDAGMREQHRLLRSYTVADGTHHDLCVGEIHEMRVHAKALTLAGLILGQQGIEAARAAFDMSSFDYPRYIMHQTSQAHLEKFSDLLGLEADRFELTYPRYGNVGACGVPLTLHQAARAGRIQPGQHVPLLGVGSGMSATWMELAW
jgi:acyl-CoA:acyl-CoA alkyltransferase